MTFKVGPGILFEYTKTTKHLNREKQTLMFGKNKRLFILFVSKFQNIRILFYAFQWITDLSVKIIFDNFTVKIIKI
jgi:hypothetical protein